MFLYKSCRAGRRLARARRRHVPAKGVQLLLAAFAATAESLPGAKLRLWGKADDQTSQNLKERYRNDRRGRPPPP